MNAHPAGSLPALILAVYAQRMGIVADAQQAAKALRRLSNRAARATDGTPPQALLVTPINLAAASAHLDAMTLEDVREHALEFESECRVGPYPNAHSDWPLLVAIVATARLAKCPGSSTSHK
jgi:hypothetical protein